MNKNIDLTKILNDCPEGTKFYSPLWGEVSFERILDIEVYTIEIDTASGYQHLTKEGCYVNREDAECILFPSKDQRDWSKFTAPWYKVEKFEPKTLKPFDKVMVRDDKYQAWFCTLFSHKGEDCGYPYDTASGSYFCCIPYNDETKHLVGTKEEAPEYYRYWDELLFSSNFS